MYVGNVSDLAILQCSISCIDRYSCKSILAILATLDTGYRLLVYDKVMRGHGSYHNSLLTLIVRITD